MIRFCLIAFALTGFLGVNSLGAQDWPGLFGPEKTARVSDEVPVEWNESSNMLWKLPLPGEGSSSPVIVGKKVFVVCYKIDGRSVSREVVCADKLTGEKLWSKEFASKNREDGYQGYITEHGYASNTPVSDGKHLFVFLGKGGVHALDFDGNVLWTVDVGSESSNRRWGSAASLVLFENSVIVNASEESQAVIALDKSDGKELWRQEASMLELAYGTPSLVSLKNGKHELVISVPSELWALNPSTGKLKWYVTTSMTGNVSPSVIVDGETVYSFGGYRSSGSLSVRAGGKDDVSQSHKNWTSRTSSYVATPLLVQDRFYWIDDRGLANCSSAKDGKEVYRERVKGLSGRPVYASPLLANNKIYVVTRRAGTIVYEPGDEFKIIAQNKIAGDNSDFNASPAISDSKIYLRSNKMLYCVGAK